MVANYGITNNQARQLEGAAWTIEHVTYRFAARHHSGEVPWHSGAEGLAYPMENATGETVQFAKFFKPSMASRKRIERLGWLIDQRLFEWAPELSAAPRQILDTRRDGRPDGVDFDFCCVVSQAVSGFTWLDAKAEIMEGMWTPSIDQRLRWVQGLVKSLAILERRGICHGDISPYNVIIERSPSSSLRLIDFDGFVSHAAGDLHCLSESEGGTIGTEGYISPELEARRHAAGGCAGSKSDRFARDMLVIEMLLFDGSWEFDEPVARSDRNRIRTLFRAAAPPAGLRHLGRGDVFTAKDHMRPESSNLAQQLEIALPPRRKHNLQQVSNTNREPRFNWLKTFGFSIALGTWMVISWSFVRSVFPTSATGFAHLLQLLAQVFLFLVTLCGGSVFLIYQLICDERGRAIDIGGVQILLPRRRVSRSRGVLSRVLARD